ncbi:MAG: hypothetical protein V2A76_17635 [Planctomycetota bacterium]
MRAKILAAMLVVLGTGFTAQAADDAVVPANLNDVRAQPRTYLKSVFEFEGRFSNHGEIFQVFFTKFDDHLYTNFAAWDVRNNLADFDQYSDRCALLYLNRHSGEQMEILFNLAKYQRFRATARVESIFGNRAFIEVIDIVALDRRLTPCAHAKKALTQQCTGGCAGGCTGGCAGGCTGCAGGCTGGVAVLEHSDGRPDAPVASAPTLSDSAVLEESDAENLVVADTE